MKKQTLLRVLCAAAVACMLPVSALGWKVTRDPAAIRGRFESGGVRFQTVPTLKLIYVSPKDDADTIFFQGSEEVKDRQAQLTLTLANGEADLTLLHTQTLMDEAQVAVGARDIACAIEYTAPRKDGTPVSHRIFFFFMGTNMPVEARTGVVDRYDMNLSGSYITIEYIAYTGTKLFDFDIQKLRELVESIAIAD